MMKNKKVIAIQISSFNFYFRSTFLTIDVVDTNDNIPVFADSQYAFQTFEVESLINDKFFLLTNSFYMLSFDFSLPPVLISLDSTSRILTHKYIPFITNNECLRKMGCQISSKRLGLFCMVYPQLQYSCLKEFNASY